MMWKLLSNDKNERGGFGLLVGILFNGTIPASFCSFKAIFLEKLQTELQWDSNQDRQSRSALDHHRGPVKITLAFNRKWFLSQVNSWSFLGNFFKVVKIYHFSMEIIFIDIWRFFSGHTDRYVHHFSSFKENNNIGHFRSSYFSTIIERAKSDFLTLLFFRASEIVFLWLRSMPSTKNIKVG